MILKAISWRVHLSERGEQSFQTAVFFSQLTVVIRRWQETYDGRRRY